MPNLSPFGKWLSDQMAREGLNPAGLAEMVGRSHTTVHKWMYGLSIPRDKNVRAIARALRVDPVDVYRAFTGMMGDARGWPEDVHALVQDYVALSPGARRAFRNMVREARELAKAVEEEPVLEEGDKAGRQPGTRSRG